MYGQVLLIEKKNQGFKMNNIKSSDNVLIIWKNGDQNGIKNFVEQIQGLAKNGSVFLENSEMITECKFCKLFISL